MLASECTRRPVVNAKPPTGFYIIYKKYVFEKNKISQQANRTDSAIMMFMAEEKEPPKKKSPDPEILTSM